MTRVTELKVQTQKTCVETGSVALTSDQFIILTQSISRISGRAQFLHQRDVADQTYIHMQCTHWLSSAQSMGLSFKPFVLASVFIRICKCSDYMSWSGGPLSSYRPS